MKTFPVVTILMLTLLLLVSQVSYAKIIFQDNFDSTPDWQPQEAQVNCITASCSYAPPTNWDYYRDDEKWHPNDYPTKNPTIRISGENYRGTSGKAFTVWNESNNGNSGDGWGADGLLAKDLGGGYTELYFQYYVKFQSDFQFYYASNNAMIKQFRVQSWDGLGAGSPFTYFTGGYSAPMYIFDTVQNEYGGIRHSHAFRCDPQSSNYFCPGHSYGGNSNYLDKETFKQKFGDNQWHLMEFHIKMNSSPGAEDGILEYSLDGVKEHSETNVAWMSSSSPGNLGWNIIAIGGNAFNGYADESKQAEQWYAIDDIVISTTPLTDTIILPPTIKNIESESK